MSIFILLIFSSAIESFSIKKEVEDNEENLERCRAFGDFGARVENFEKEECQVLFSNIDDFKDIFLTPFFIN